MEAFFPLRAAGLALEQAYKLCPHKGADNVTVQDLSSVRVTGTLQAFEAGEWHECQQRLLQLKVPDAALALKIFLKTRSLFADFSANIWHIDKPLPGLPGAFDLLCVSFPEHQHFFHMFVFQSV